LKTIKDKKAAIEKIDSQINGDIEGEKIVTDYLPENKAEERILSAVNYLATDSAVSLINITLVDASLEDKNDNTLSAAGILAPIINTSAPAAKPASTDLKFSEATISVTGEYAKIKLFIEQLQHVPMLNDVKKVTISPTPVERGKEDVKVDPSKLFANIVIDFGWMKMKKMDNQKIANFVAGVDVQTADTLKKFVSKKTAAPGALAENAGDNKGKSNPFLQ